MPRSRGGMIVSLAVVPWALFALLVLVRVRRRPLLSEWDPIDPHRAPAVSVIVPARDEEDNIGPCLEGLRATEYGDLEIIVVDDGSRDRTADVVGVHAASDTRIRLIRPAPPDAGWIGKPWACARGADIARGEVLIFTDADVRHHPEAVARAVRALRDTGSGLVSGLPRQLLPTFWERLVMPVVTLMILLRFPDPARVNRSGRSRDKLAVGGFLVVTRKAYDAVGGHAAVRHEVAEDLRLGQSVHAAGFPVHLLVADEFISVRMYRSFPEIVAGWSKNIAIGSRQTVPGWLAPAVPWLIALWLLVAWVAPPAVLVVALLAGSSALSAWGAAVYGISAVFWAGIHRRFGVPLPYAALHPAGAAVAAGIVIRSAILGPTVIWKGRTYRTAEWTGAAHVTRGEG